MILLTLITALAIKLHWGSLALIQRDSWFFAWVKRVDTWPLVGGSAALKFLLALGVPVIGLVLLLDLLSGFSPLLLFAANLGILLYSFGQGDLSAELNRVELDLQRGDIQAAVHAGGEFGLGKYPLDAADLPMLAMELRASLSYAYFSRYLAVVFWYVLGGVAGALLYRLLLIYLLVLQRETHEGEEGSSLARFSVALLERLPLALVGLSLALVGRFGSGLSTWFGRLFSGNATMRILQDGVDDALNSQNNVNEEAVTAASMVANCTQIDGLFKRILLGWVCLVALGLILS